MVWVLIAHWLILDSSSSKGGLLHLLDFIRGIYLRIIWSALGVCRWISELVEQVVRHLLLSYHRSMRLQLRVQGLNQLITRTIMLCCQCLLKIKHTGSCLRRRLSVTCSCLKSKRCVISHTTKSMERWPAQKMEYQNQLCHWTTLKSHSIILIIRKEMVRTNSTQLEWASIWKVYHARSSLYNRRGLKLGNKIWHHSHRDLLRGLKLIIRPIITLKIMNNLMIQTNIACRLNSLLRHLNQEQTSTNRVSSSRKIFWTASMVCMGYYQVGWNRILR